MESAIPSQNSWSNKWEPKWQIILSFNGSFSFLFFNRSSFPFHSKQPVTVVFSLHSRHSFFVFNFIFLSTLWMLNAECRPQHPSNQEVSLMRKKLENTKLQVIRWVRVYTESDRNEEDIWTVTSLPLFHPNFLGKIKWNRFNGIKEAQWIEWKKENKFECLLPFHFHPFLGWLEKTEKKTKDERIQAHSHFRN